MATMIGDDVREMISKIKLGFFATAGKDGTPNVSPKGSIQVIDENTLVFSVVKSPHTLENLRENPRVSALVFDPQERRGYQIKGTSELFSEGPLWDKVAPRLIERGYEVHAVVKITPESIFEVKSSRK